MEMFIIMKCVVGLCVLERGDTLSHFHVNDNCGPSFLESQDVEQGCE